MKFSILLFSLFIICVSGSTSGTTPDHANTVKISEPVFAIAGMSYKDECHMKDADKEVQANLDYSVQLAKNINTKLADHKVKLSHLLTPMCQKDDKLKSFVVNAVKKVCDPKAPQSEIVQKIMDRTCNDMIPRVIRTWRKGKDVDIDNYKEH